MSIRPMSAISDIKNEVWVTLKEALDAGVDPDIAIDAARDGINEFLRDCNEWAAEAAGMTAEDQL